MSGGFDPCPFCAGNAALESIRDGFKARCHTCGASGPSVFNGPGGWSQCRADALTAWNTRAALSALHGEEMREKIARLIWPVAFAHRTDGLTADQLSNMQIDARNKASAIMALIGGGGDAQ